MRSLLAIIFCVNLLVAQNTNRWDTTRYQKFRANLIVGLYQSHRNFENKFSQIQFPDTFGFSEQTFTAESQNITGIDITYDKFSLAFGVRTTPQKNSEGKGKTDTYSFGFNFGGNKWLLENGLRYFKGFYISSPAFIDTNETGTAEYYLRPNFTNTLIRSKFMFFTNHKKYSFKSNYSCNYRQLKSGGTWIFSGNTHYNYMYNDSSFFHPRVRELYGDKAELHGVKVFGISTNAGGAYTIVWWRAFFAHVMFMIGPEQQWRTYNYPDKSVNVSQLSLSYDLRGVIGVNFKKFYFTFYGGRDAVLYNTKFMHVESTYIVGGTTLGWRFRSKIPEFYKKFQDTKLYLSI